MIKSKRYRKECVNDLLAAVYKAQELVNRTADDSNVFDVDNTSAKGVSDTVLDISCCYYNRFKDCANGFIEKECGLEAVDAWTEFTSKTFGGGASMFCPRAYFDPKDKLCTDIMPPIGSDPKTRTLLNNPIGKYALNHLNFIFNFDVNDSDETADDLEKSN